MLNSLEPTERTGPDYGFSVPLLREAIAAKLASSKLEMFPFPHLIIEDFFPGPLYRKILDYNLFRKNRGQPWVRRYVMPFMKGSTPYDHRTQINFHKDEPYEAEEEERRFWNGIRETFISDNWFVKLVYEKFPAYFDIRFGEIAAKGDLWPLLRRELFLQQHEPDYAIGPHTDIATRVFTCIFSFAEKPGFEEFGTQLLTHRDPLVRCWGDAHYRSDDFTVARTAEYRPNNFLLFFKTRQSFHAVKTIAPEIPNARYGMQLQCYEPRGGLFRDLSRPDLMEDHHFTLMGRLAEKLVRKLLSKP